MACTDLRRSFVRFCVIMLIGIWFPGLGCESGASSSATLPGPNFAGPVVTSSVPPIPPPPPMASLDKPAPRLQVTDRSVPASWVPSPGVPRRAWKWIVIHHSATPDGGAARFDKAHKAKGWDELGYHFVIGNGTDTPDGMIEVGSRWSAQKHGAHAKTPDNRYNDYGIGICLVGNFDLTRPTEKQMASLVRLVTYLADEYRIPTSNILGHSMTGKSTDCPGKFMDIQALRAAVARQRKGG